MWHAERKQMGRVVLNRGCPDEARLCTFEPPDGPKRDDTFDRSQRRRAAGRPALLPRSQSHLQCLAGLPGGIPRADRTTFRPQPVYRRARNWSLPYLTASHQHSRGALVLSRQARALQASVRGTTNGAQSAILLAPPSGKTKMQLPIQYGTSTGGRSLSLGQPVDDGGPVFSYALQAAPSLRQSSPKCGKQFATQTVAGFVAVPAAL
uniref:Uncharacterized protein n=1 Tax=Trichuris muris TaxID=70415 RepID=A0A5S6Q6N8_TRIMR